MKEKSDMGWATFFFGMAHGAMIGSVLAFGAINSDFVKIDTDKICNKNGGSIPHRQTILPSSLSPEPPHIQ